jgi:hypothetical protein
MPIISEVARDTFSLTFEVLGSSLATSLVRTIAVRTDKQDEPGVEAQLTINQVREIMNRAYGGQAFIVNEQLAYLEDWRLLTLGAEGHLPALFSQDELVSFGFNPDDFESAE